MSRDDILYGRRRVVQSGILGVSTLFLPTSRVSAQVDEEDMRRETDRKIPDVSTSGRDLINAISTEFLREEIESASFSGADVQQAIFGIPIVTAGPPLQDFPRQGITFTVLSTGRAANAQGNAGIFESSFIENSADPSGISAPTGGDINDLALLSATINIPEGAQRLRFEYRFGTEENPTFLNSQFQDFFRAKVTKPDGSVENIAKLPNGEPVTVDNANPFSNSPQGSSASPNSPLPSPNDVVYNSVTQLLTGTVNLSPFDPGEKINIEFQIADVGDTALDSGVLLDNLNLGALSINKAQTRPVQIAEMTRIAGSPSYDKFPNPRLVAGRNVAILFGVDAADLDYIPSTDPITVTATVDGQSIQDSIELNKSDLNKIQGSSERELIETFDNISTDPPILELPATDSQIDISVEIEPDINDDGKDEFPSNGVTLSSGEDFIAGIPNQSPDVAIARLVDPDGGSNYGSGSNGEPEFFDPSSNQSITDFDDLVRLIRNEFEKRLPVIPSRLEISQLGEVIEGDVSNQSANVIRDDAQRAYDQLDEVFEFNAAVLIVPDGYFDYHRDPAGGLHFGADSNNGNFQPPVAALTNNRLSTLHELCHHYLPDEPYPSIAAQRDRGGNDRDHARTFERDYDDDGNPNTTDNTINDRPGVVSAGFDVLDGNYDVRGNSNPPEPQNTANIREVNSTLSYADPSGPDTLIIDFLADSGGGGGYVPRPPVEDNSGGGSSDSDIPVLSLSADRDDGSLEIRRIRSRMGRPSPSTPSGELSAKIKDGSGSVLAERRFPDSLEVHPSSSSDSVSRGLPSEFIIENSYAFAIEFPQEATRVQLTHEDGTQTELNPITRTLRDLISNIPDNAFIPNPDGAREELNNRLDTVNRHISNDRYRPARNVLEGIQKTLRQTLKDDYKTDSAEEPTKEEVLNTVSDRISRLQTILEQKSDNNGKVNN